MLPRIPAKKLRIIRAHLHQGGIIAYATESCFGFGVLPNNARALKNLIKLKKRDMRKGMIVIGENLAQFKPYIAPLTTLQRQYLMLQWPAPKTFLVPSKKTTLALLRGYGHSNLAIRIPEHAQALGLCHQLRTALVSTSANISKRNPGKTFYAVHKQFSKKILVIKGNIGHYSHSSTIIDLKTRQRIR